MRDIYKKINLYLFVLLAVFLAFKPISVYAIDLNYYSSNDILYYDPDACKSGGSGSSALSGNDNAEKILRFLVGKGLTLVQAAGIIGNWEQESGLDPRAVQPSTTTDDPNYKPVSGVGFGLAQWTYYTRQDKMYAYHQETGQSMIDLSFQLDWFWKEFTEDYAGGVVTLKQQTTVSDAAVDFHSSFEGSADTASMIQERVQSGEAYYEQYKSTIADGSGSSASTSATCNASSGSASNFIDGFAIYNQYDPQWADKPYGGSATIGESGCGPSAMAMIITALTGQKVTPLDTATYGAQNGTTANDGEDGSNWNIQTIVGEHWGLKSEQISADVNEINTKLQAGALIITSGSGAAPFTSGGHYIVIRAVTAGGKWLIGDSNGDKGTENSKTEWDPATIIDGMAKGNVWAVTK